MKKHKKTTIDWQWIGSTISKALTYFFILVALGFIIFLIRLAHAAKNLQW